MWLDCANKASDVYAVSAIDAETGTDLGNTSCADTLKMVATLELSETDLSRTVYGAANDLYVYTRKTPDQTVTRAQFVASARWAKTSANTANLTVAVDGPLGVETLRFFRNGTYATVHCSTGNSCTQEITDIAGGGGAGSWTFDLETATGVHTTQQALPPIPTTWPAAPQFTELKPGRCPDSRSCTSANAGDPVDTMTGTFHETLTDLAVGSRGPGLWWGRDYATVRAAATGPLGSGWMHSWAWTASVNVPAGTATVTDPQGNATPYVRQAVGSWKGPGYTARRVRLHTDNTLRLERPGTDDGYAFVTAGKLGSVTDRNGEALAFTYTSGNLTGVAGQSWQSLTVTWTSGRVTKVVDQSGRQVLYGYTGTDLTSVTDADGYVWG